MKYRYYVHNRNTNTGVTEFSSNLWGHFIECLCDCIDFLTYECDDTLHYEFYIHNGEEKTTITFSFVEVDGDAQMVCYISKGNDSICVPREDIRDYIKANFN